MLNFALSSSPKGGKSALSIYPALKPPIFIGCHNQTFEESKAKKPLVNILDMD